jgi:hypothetical protein
LLQNAAAEAFGYLSVAYEEPPARKSFKQLAAI